MPEPVRLVIWDLDETLWRGTLSEGGITELVDAHKDIVMALAARGVVSSICSKNDFDAARSILQNWGLWDYFVFPSIEWGPKAPRVAKIIEAVQLRPETIRFIDDNPSNLAEVGEYCPGVQVAGPESLATLLDDPAFRGKDDAACSRLQHYKLLERRASDQTRHVGDVTDFLRHSNIRVSVEYDIAAHAPRAVELINRTNQLNYTKRRLPDDVADASAQLLAEISAFTGKAGLVRVRDNYGDYGFVGFYAVDGYKPKEVVKHFCFSCRTLGMAIESWIYQNLGCPGIAVQGEVVTPLEPDRKIDWIHLDNAAEGAPASAAGKPEIIEIRMRGQCEVNALSHYFAAEAKYLRVSEGAIKANVYASGNATANLLLGSSLDAEALERELTPLGLTGEDFASDFLATRYRGTLLIVSLFGDYYLRHLQHKTLDMFVCVTFYRFWTEIVAADDEKLTEYFERENVSEKDRDRLRAIQKHIREHYDLVRMDGAILQKNIRALAERAPRDAELFLILPPHKVRLRGEVHDFPHLAEFSRLARESIADYANVHAVPVDDYIRNDSDLQEGWFHFDRMVYYRLYASIMTTARARQGEERRRTAIETP